MSLVENAKKFQNRRLELANQIKELAERAKAAAPDDDENKWTAEDEAAWKKLNAEYDENHKQLETANKELKEYFDRKERVAERVAAIEREAVENPEALYKRLGKDGASATDHLRDQIEDDARADDDQSRQKHLQFALHAWACSNRSDFQMTAEHVNACRALRINPTAKELEIALPRNYNAVRATLNQGKRVWNALSTETGTAGQFTFTDSFTRNLELAMLAFGGMLNTSQVMRTASGERMMWPTATDTANTGRQIGESAAVATNVDPTFGGVWWDAYKFTSDFILVPFELFQDSLFDLPSILGEMLGERLGRILNTKCTTGTGAGTPKGIVTASVLGVTAASATAIAFDEIIDLEHSIDPSRRNLAGVGYMFHDSILQALRKLKDGEGRYLWQSGANSGAPDTLNTFTYQINQDMASSIASGNKTILFGQLSQYKIREVGAVRMYRLVERYRDNDQDGIGGFMRFDGNLLDAGDNPVKHLVQ